MPSPLAASPLLDRSIRFGTHLFVNPEDDAALLRERIRVLDEAGFRLVRLFLPWSQLEPRPGEWRWGPFDEIFDEAAARGMKIVATLMSVSPPGWAGQTGGLQDVADLDDEAFWQQSLAHVRTVVARFSAHPALDSWILWNEPCRSLRPDNPNAVAAFRRHLERAYRGDIAVYNAAHYRPAKDFASIELLGRGGYETGFGSHRAKVEWLEFTVENLQEKLEGIAREVRRIDRVHPIHVNPHRVSQCLADAGQSIWREADLVDFIGCSAHPAWHSVRFPRARYADSVAMFADLMRSATRAPDGYFWVTELQGGTTLMSAFEPLAPSPDEARLWLWQSLGAGAKAVVYWCANARSEGYEAGEWDLLDYRGQASPRLRAISRTIRALAPRLPLLAAATPPRADIAIVVSEESLVLDLVEGVGDEPANPRNRQKGADAVAGAYLLAADLSLEVAFYDLRRLREAAPGTLPEVLVLPGLAVLDSATLERLHAFADAGGLVIADGFFAWKDRHGRLAAPLREAATRLWGAECVGYEALPEQAWFGGDGGRLRGCFARALFEPGAALVAARWDDGAAAVLRHRVGAGAACRVGTHLFQRYFTCADAAAAAWFRRLVAGALPARPRLLNAWPSLRMRRLNTAEGELLILINGGARDETARVALPDGRELAVIVPARDGTLLGPAASAAPGGFAIPAREPSLAAAHP